MSLNYNEKHNYVLEKSEITQKDVDNGNESKRTATNKNKENNRCEM